MTRRLRDLLLELREQIEAMQIMDAGVCPDCRLDQQRALRLLDEALEILDGEE